jgi:hypothetical protein
MSVVHTGRLSPREGEDRRLLKRMQQQIKEPLGKVEASAPIRQLQRLLSGLFRSQQWERCYDD